MFETIQIFNKKKINIQFINKKWMKHDKTKKPHLHNW